MAPTVQSTITDDDLHPKIGEKNKNVFNSNIVNSNSFEEEKESSSCKQNCDERGDISDSNRCSSASEKKLVQSDKWINNNLDSDDIKVNKTVLNQSEIIKEAINNVNLNGQCEYDIHLENTNNLNHSDFQPTFQEINIDNAQLACSSEIDVTQLEKNIVSKTLTCDKKTNNEITPEKCGNCLINEIEKLVMNSKLENITSLILVNLELDKLDYDFSPLVNILEIDLSNNKLSELPDSFKTFKKCSKLNLSKNNFYEVPDVLYRDLYFIRFLDLSFNFIKDFNLSPLCIPYLISLNVSYNQLICPPWWLIHDIASCLNYLNLSFNPCFKEKLHQSMLETFVINRISSNIVELDVSNTGLNSLNIMFLKQFTCLKILRVSTKEKFKNYGLNNSLDELPFDILNQMPLVELEAEDCCLTLLPQNVEKLLHLKFIKISNNNLSWLPESLAELECLQVLAASKCHLVYLPKYMGSITTLTHLWLALNDISSLPDMTECKNLKVLDLYSNSFSEMPESITNLNLEAFDICGNYFDPSSYKQVSNGKDYNALKAALREMVPYCRTNYIKIEGYRETSSSSQSRKSSCYSGSPQSFDSTNSCNSKRRRDIFYRESFSSSYQEESWDVDPDDAWDPNFYSVNKTYSSMESLTRIRSVASYTYKDDYFCPFKEISNFHQHLSRPKKNEDEKGQFDDA